MQAHHELMDWGWDEGWAREFGAIGAAGVPGRVTARDRGLLTLQLAHGPVRGIWRGERGGEIRSPEVGDWCVVEPPTGDGPAVVLACLPRRTALTRKAAGRATVPQVLAANVDTVVLVCGLDHSQGMRSIERLLILVLDGGARPLIVLNKADRCDDVEHQLQRARMAAPGFEVLATSAALGTGLDPLRGALEPGSTVLLMGPSGAGKSTLLNALEGADVAATGAVRAADRRGRHTTTRRQLYRMSSGVLLMDTPGLRELAAWLDGDGLREAFEDIESLAAGCRFRDCSHDNEPGCAVREALESGQLEARRFWRYLDLTREAESLATRRDRRHRCNSKRRFKGISTFARRLKRERDKP